jgi:hypothetical protein
VSDDGRLSPEILRVAVVVIVGAIMSVLDTTIVNVALETLARDPGPLRLRKCAPTRRIGCWRPR